MQFLKGPLNIDFIGRRRRVAALAVSLVLVVAAIVSLATRGLNLGIDFTGGMLIEMGYPEAVELEPIRGALAEAGFDEAIVQHFGTPQDVLIRLQSETTGNKDEISNQVIDALRAKHPDVKTRRVEFVGPQVGEQLTNQGGQAVLFALIGILIYVWLRFQMKFAPGAVAALVHDVLIMLGVFAFFRIPFDLTILAAVLAVIGYSLNDTIVVFDRIRENFRRMRKGDSVDVINASVNQTLARTIMTSLTTLLVLFALFFVGGEVIHGFALALIIGVVVGSYSSIYIASVVSLLLGIDRTDMMPVQKEGEEAGTTP